MPEKQRYELPNRNKVRSLKQFRDMTEEQFDEYWEKRIADVVPSAELETRINLKLEEFDNDYDLTDLKINDRMVLRALIQSLLQLEDLEQALYRIREGGISPDKIAMVRDINNVMDTLRKSISQMQEDLRITRKVRKGDREQTVITYLENLKLQAKKFYEATNFYVFCPKCKMLLSTAWFLYPNSKNKLTLTCDRKISETETCGETFTITSKDLLDNRGTNNKEVPESMF